MVDGLKYFMTRFAGFEDYFVLIGGTACDLWMADIGLAFRATKDLDIVLVADSLPEAFIKEFWTFIREGQYESLEQSETRPSFYRFKNPKDPRHPATIELFSPNFLPVSDEHHLTPIPTGEDVSSLSAILLDTDYFDYIVRSRTTIDGVPTVPAQCLIPLKAKTHLDLTARRAAGERIDGRDIKKHRNDVFRLYRTLAPSDRFTLTDSLRADLARFLESLPPDSPDWASIQAAVDGLPKPDQVLTQIRANFGIHGTQ